MCKQTEHFSAVTCESLLYYLLDNFIPILLSQTGFLARKPQEAMKSIGILMHSNNSLVLHNHSFPCN